MAEDKPRFISLSGKSWADEEDEAPAPTKTEPPKTWGKVEPVKAVSIAEQLQEAEKKAATAGPASRSPPPSSSTSAPYSRSDRRHEEGYRERDRDRERQRNPFPTEPPYTAFFGNLSYDVDEQKIYDYFGELGIKNIRLVTDQSGRPKGFAYVEFETADGLEKALSASGIDFHGRRLNIDIAAPRQREDKYGHGRRFGDRGFGRSGFGRRDYEPPAERPRLELKPRTKPLNGSDAASTTANAASTTAASTSSSTAGDAPAPSSSTRDDPFGPARMTDLEKLNQLAAERLRREQEREERLRAERKALEERRQRELEERRQRERERHDRGGHRGDRRDHYKSEREQEIDAKDSWRRKPGEEPTFRSLASRGGRGDRPGWRGRGVQQDEDGFITRPAKGAAHAHDDRSEKGTKNNEGSVSNPYDALKDSQ